MLEKFHLTKQNVIKGIIIDIITTMLSVFLFSLILFYTQKWYEFATVMGTASIALGSFFTALFLGSKAKRKGIVVGLLVGAFNFLIVVIGGLISSEAAVSINTLFHFIIIFLSALIGGILGVNRKSSEKYYK